MKFTKAQLNHIRMRYLQHTGSIEEDTTFIQPQITKRNELKSETWILISNWMEKCVKRTENKKENK
jgi:hypothetical protein